MINFEKDGTVFNYRIAGLCWSEGKVLFHQVDRDTFWTLPGGRCEMGETSADTLEREFMEECGREITNLRPIWTVENFFEYEGRQYHELSLIYRYDFAVAENNIPGEDFFGSEGGRLIRYSWLDASRMSGRSDVYPAFLRRSLATAPETHSHVIQRDF